MNEDTREQEEELEEVMLSYLHLPPELDFTAKFYHFEWHSQERSARRQKKKKKK